MDCAVNCLFCGMMAVFLLSVPGSGVFFHLFHKGGKIRGKIRRAVVPLDAGQPFGWNWVPQISCSGSSDSKLSTIPSTDLPVTLSPRPSLRTAWWWVELTRKTGPKRPWRTEPSSV